MQQRSLPIIIVVLATAVVALVRCNAPDPPSVSPTPTVVETTVPTLTTVIPGPPSPHASATLRPTPTNAPTITSVIVVPTAIPSWTPAAPATEPPDVLPVLIDTPAPTVTPIFRPAAPVQIPRGG